MKMQLAARQLSAIRASKPQRVFRTKVNVATPDNQGSGSEKPKPTPTPTPGSTPTSSYVYTPKTPEPAQPPKEPVTPSVYVDLPPDTLKNALIDSVKDSDRGIKMSKQERSEIDEYIAQIEAKNPTPAPTEAFDLLEGTWKLLYTSNPMVLNAFQLPGVELSDITQTIDKEKKTLEAKFNFVLPVFKTYFAIVSTFEISSAKRLKLKFKNRIFGRPSVAEDTSLPTQLNIFGQMVDISQVSQPLTPIYDTIVGQLSNILDQSPDYFELPVDTSAQEFWLLTTFLDEDFRISKTPNGTVLVLQKEKVELPEPEIVGSS